MRRCWSGSARFHRETNQAYGAPWISLDLRDEGMRVGRKRIARLMRADGLRGADGRRGGPRTPPGSRPSRRRPDLVDRRFAHSEPNQDPWDNALTETFFASLEQELLRRERFHAREQARMRLFRYIESRPPRSAPTSTKPNAIKTTPPTTRRHGNPVTTRPGEDQRSPATRAPTSCRDGNGKPPLAGRARASRWRPCLWGGPVGIPEPILIRGSAVTCGTDSRTSNH